MTSGFHGGELAVQRRAITADLPMLLEPVNTPPQALPRDSVRRHPDRMTECLVITSGAPAAPLDCPGYTFLGPSWPPSRPVDLPATSERGQTVVPGGLPAPGTPPWADRGSLDGPVHPIRMRTGRPAGLRMGRAVDVGGGRRHPEPADPVVPE
jgi:hypothetical protein